MKKLSIILAALILVSGFAFAQEDSFFEDESERRERPIEFFNMEIGVGFPVHWTNAPHDDVFYEEIFGYTIPDMMRDKSATANTAIGLAMIFNFSRGFGWALDVDFFYGAKLAGFASPTSDYNGMSGANIFFGPVFYIFNNNVLRLPLGIGAHLYYFTDEIWVPFLEEGAWLNRHDLQVGLGASLGVQFHFSRDIYLFSKTAVAIDFFRQHKIYWFDSADLKTSESSFGDGFHINWTVKPSLGLGIKY